MAEFAEVMRQFNRMCKANAGCFNCPLHGLDGIDRCRISAFVRDPNRIEREVMSWAAEYPEPLYPTWAEWLTDQAVMVIGERGCYGNILPMNKIFTPIPADIAQKLGIEPIEPDAE